MEVDEKKALIWFVVVASFVVMLLGVIGMGVCFLFLWSSSQIDAMGAGMGFITGAIMLGSGLIALAVVSPHAKKRE